MTAGLRDLVHLAKFEGKRPLICTWARLILATPALDAALRHADALVPVPAEPWRLRWRGFDAVALLAEQLAAAVGKPLYTDLLYKTRRTPPQSTLNVRVRQQNLAGSFGVNPGLPYENGQVMLIDDVVTTGATLTACATVLKARYPCLKITAVTLARTL